MNLGSDVKDITYEANKIAFRESTRAERKPMVQTPSPLS